MSPLSAIRFEITSLVPPFFFFPHSAGLRSFEEFHLKMQIPLGEASSSLKENRGGKCMAPRSAAAFVNTAFGRKKILAQSRLFPRRPENCCRSFPKATSVKGRTGRNNSQCTSVWDARQMKSSGEQREQPQAPPSLNRNFKGADIGA